jgi:hypothetical protein
MLGTFTLSLILTLAICRPSPETEQRNQVFLLIETPSTAKNSLEDSDEKATHEQYG